MLQLGGAVERPGWGFSTLHFPNLGSRAGAQPEMETIRAQPKLNSPSCSKYTDQELACVNRKKHESELDLLCEDHLMKPGSSLLSVSGTIGVSQRLK